MEISIAVSTPRLGIIGSGSMYPDILTHVVKCKKATKNNFAVNIPLLYPNIESHIDTVIKIKFLLYLHLPVALVFGQKN